VSLLRTLSAADRKAAAGAARASKAELLRRFGGDLPGLKDAPLGVFAPGSEELLGLVWLEAAEPGGAGRLNGWIRTDKTGEGWGAKAGQEALAWAFKKRGLRRVYARIEPANRAARRVLQKLGFRYEGRLRQDLKLNGRWVDQECWAILRKEWK
jgi:RimJ/RimL family protein N-acetyltransferase